MDQDVFPHPPFSRLKAGRKLYEKNTRDELGRWPPQGRPGRHILRILATFLEVIMVNFDEKKNGAKWKHLLWVGF